MRRLRFGAIFGTFTVAAATAALAVGSSTERTISAVGSDLEQGRAALDARDYAVALAALNRARAADPGNPDIENGLGHAYRGRGLYDAALSHYDTALQIAPNHLGTLDDLGELFLALGQPAKARAQLDALVRLCPKGCAARQALEEAFDVYRAAHPQG